MDFVVATCLGRRLPIASALAVFIIGAWLALSGSVMADEFADKTETFVQESCIGCHDSDTETRLDFESLGYDLKDDKTFRKWVMVFDRVERGEMPPSESAQPGKESRFEFLQLLRTELTQANRTDQALNGRVPSRRLSRKEYENTLRDLLGIGGQLARYLPDETESGVFDVVADKQDISAVHIRGFLKAADKALDEAIQLGQSPNMREREIKYHNSPYIQMWVDRPVRRGGGTIFKTSEDIVTFRGENYVFRSDTSGFKPPVAGQYRISILAAPHQQRSSITVSLKRQNDKQGDSALIAAWDLANEKYREVSTVTYLRPDDFIYPSADELEPAPNGRVIYNSQPAKDFKGEGVRIRRVTVEGPLEKSWPPERTRNLFPGIEWRRKTEDASRAYAYEPVLTKAPLEHIKDSINALASKAFRRPLSEAELAKLAALAKPSLDSGTDFVHAAKVPLRAILTSPEVLFLTGDAGELNDQQLARRLSYFLWRSLPDEELNQLAANGQLEDHAVLQTQANRLLLDSRSTRFINDFLDQWLDLDQIDSTTPDVYLYPEYDDILRQAMLAETREFFACLVRENLSVENLVDSDFTFLNRRLAEHYGIQGVVGEKMRKVQLDANSYRGGILTHASIAKVTANGTVTSPVKRGNFVLTNLLGLPPNPPPPDAGKIEPDTRGAKSIRDALKKHQAIESCAVCHRQIDPPGFALECFDPVGNFRMRYRNSRGIKREINTGLRFLHKDYTLGLAVDPSGVTAGGTSFKDIRDFRRQLRASTRQVARNLLNQLFAFASGGEIEFADRAEVERILDETSTDGYPLRTLIHKVVASKIFRSR